MLVVKNPPANTGDIGDDGLIPGAGRSPGGQLDNPLQYSCLENPHGQRSLAGYNPRGRKELDTVALTEQSTAQVSTAAAVGAVEPKRLLVQKKGNEGTSLAVQCLRLHASNAGGWV